MPSSDFQEALRYYLNVTGQDNSLTSAQRVYWRRAPERTVVPYLVFSDMTPQPLHSHSGADNLIQRTFQLSHFDRTQSDAAVQANLLRRMMDGFKGPMGVGENTVTVGACLWKGQFYNYEPDTKLHMEALDFWFQFFDFEPGP